jgi:hypothetical protein
LWAKAFAEAQGNEVKAKAIYINLRVKQIKLGVAVENEMVNRMERLLNVSAEKGKVALTAPAPAPAPAKPAFYMLDYESQQDKILRNCVYCKVCGSNNLRIGRTPMEGGHFCINCGKLRPSTDFALV